MQCHHPTLGAKKAGWDWKPVKGASCFSPRRKLRWHSFQNSHRPSLNSASLEINRQSAARLNLLQKCSLLRLTAIMEKYSMPQKQTWAW